MPSDSGPNPRRSNGNKAQNLLARFPIIDLAHAVALDGSNRRAFLTNFVDGFTTLSYLPTRTAAPMIYGAQKPLFETPIAPWSEIERFIITASRPDILDMNLDASKHLFDLVRDMGYLATECEPQVLRVRLRQIVNINLSFYVTQGARLIFQFPLPRKEFITENALRVLGSILHHAYVQGDFSSAEVEIADVGSFAPRQPRAPRIRPVSRESILDLNALTEQIDDVYDMLRVLAAR